MANKKVYIKIVADRSGSMSSCLTDAQGGYDTFLAERLKDTDFKQWASLREFDNEHNLVYDFVPLADAQSRNYKIHPRGTTALYDAISKGVSEFEANSDATKKSVEKIVVIITDGYENSSREINAETLKTLIERKQSDGWKFIFLGANQDAITAAGAIGIPMATAMTYDSHLATTATASASNMISRGLQSGLYAYSGAERSASVGNNTVTWTDNNDTNDLKWFNFT